ncbi:MAG: NAD(+)/NADH kinase [bacterium]
MFERVGIYPNPNRQEVLLFARDLADEIEQRGVRTLFPAVPKGSSTPPGSGTFPPEIPDLILSLGGDGTLLSCLRVAGELAPILGVNLGDVGYLSATTSGRILLDLDAILAGHLLVEERTMVSLKIGDRTAHGLNECAILHRQQGRSIRLLIQINGQELGEVRGDGLLVATPSGSTAYAMACGGPLIDPSLDLLLLCAVAPHSLFSRPILLNRESNVVVHPRGREQALALVDGQELGPVRVDQPALISLSPKKTRLAYLEPGHFIQDVQRKLHWGRL